MSPYDFLRRRDVESIPARGAIVVTATQETAKVLRDGVRKLRGDDLAKRCRFVSINRRGDEDKPLVWSVTSCSPTASGSSPRRTSWPKLPTWHAAS